MFINKFGIEIEFLGMGCYTDSIAARLDRDGLEVVEDGYDGKTDLAWFVKGDGSVFDDDAALEVCNDSLEYDSDPCGECDGCDECKGAEIVSSPMIFNADSELSIRELCHHLDKHGAYVNKSCGLHVHVDASFVERMSQSQAGRFFEHIRVLYAKNEDVFDARMARGRQKDRNTYCRTMKWALADRHDRNVNYDLSRYVKLNTCAFVQHGTIEFRHHHGTVDAQEIIDWVKTCLIFMNYARETFEASERAAWETEMCA